VLRALELELRIHFCIRKRASLTGEENMTRIASQCAITDFQTSGAEVMQGYS